MFVFIMSDQIHQLMLRNMRSIRKAKGLTQQDVADKMDLPVSYFNKLETGKVDPRMSTLHKVCGAMEISIAELFDDPKDMSLKDKLRKLNRLGEKDQSAIEHLIEVIFRSRGFE